MRDAQLLADLARVKAIFQLRAVCTAIGIDPIHRASAPTGVAMDWSTGREALSPRLPTRSADAGSHLHASANIGKHEGYQLADAECCSSHAVASNSNEDHDHA